MNVLDELTRRAPIIPFLRRTVLFLSTSIALVAPPASAQEAPNGRDVVATMVEARLGQQFDIAGIRALILDAFEAADVDGGGLSRTDEISAAQLQRASQRAQILAQYFQYDLDGDGVIPAAELDRALTLLARKPVRNALGQVVPTDAQVVALVRRHAAALMLQDADGDGTLSAGELSAAADARVDPHRTPRPGPVAQFMTGFDADADGTVTRAEVVAPLDAVLAELDTDGDGRVSEREAAAFRIEVLPEARRRVSQASRRSTAQTTVTANRDRCGIGPYDETVRILDLTAVRGRALSTVSLVGETDATSVVDLDVAEGEGPIVLVLNGMRPVIFRVTGAVDRIEAVLVSARTIGITGVDRNKVRFLFEGPCRDPVLAASRGHKSSPGWIEAMLGRAPDTVWPRRILSRVTLPDGEDQVDHTYPGAQALDLDGPAGAVWRVFLGRYPGGLVDLDAAAVVSGNPAGDYAVPPFWAGLARLVERGDLAVVEIDSIVDAVTPGPDGRVRFGIANLPQTEGRGQVSDMSIRTNGLTYRQGIDGIWRGTSTAVFRVLRDTTLPAAIAREDVVFELAPGVPAPRGGARPQQIRGRGE